jgi:hypothetical protein
MSTSQIPARFTGTALGAVTTDPRTGEECRQVFLYENGECTDAYVTITCAKVTADA